MTKRELDRTPALMPLATTVTLVSLVLGVGLVVVTGVQNVSAALAEPLIGLGISVIVVVTVLVILPQLLAVRAIQRGREWGPVLVVVLCF